MGALYQERHCRVCNKAEFRTVETAPGVKGRVAVIDTTLLWWLVALVAAMSLDGAWQVGRAEWRRRRRK